MVVYRISKMKERAQDLSGKGAFLFGGRWNSEGTFMLYTSLNASLAMLEVLVHADESEIPPQMFISHIEIDGDAPMYQFPDKELPNNWREPGNLHLKMLGDRMVSENKFIGFQARSAVLPSEWNILLNPQFPDYSKHVRIQKVDRIETDIRLLGF
jgi:RES domain-containing protein